MCFLAPLWSVHSDSFSDEFLPRYENCYGTFLMKYLKPLGRVCVHVLCSAQFDFFFRVLYSLLLRCQKRLQEVRNVLVANFCRTGAYLLCCEITQLRDSPRVVNFSYAVNSKTLYIQGVSFWRRSKKKCLKPCKKIKPLCSYLIPRNYSLETRGVFSFRFASII